MNEGPARNNLTVIQYNCGNANYRGARPFFDSLRPEKHHIIAIQEPAISKRNKATYTPPGYHLGIHPNQLTKTAFLISKEIKSSEWHWTHHNENLSSIRLTLREGTLRIINVYNPSPATRSSHTPSQIANTSEVVGQAIQEESEILLVGDFNLHHPEWGGPTASTDAHSTRLIQLINRANLTLLLPPGEITWERNEHRTTIDLAFGSTSIAQRLLRCEAKPGWGMQKDHHPVVVQLDLQTIRIPQTQKYAIKKLQTQEFRRELYTCLETAGLLPRQTQTRNPEDEGTGIPEDFRVRTPTTTEGIDEIIEETTEAIWASLEANCPKLRPSQYSRKTWSQECRDLVQERRKARRKATLSGEATDRQEAKRLRNKVKARIRDDTARAWREFVQEAAAEPLTTTKIWTLSRWVRRKAGMPPAPPQIPPLRHTPDAETTTSFQGKADILKNRFFPPPTQADLSDIDQARHAYPPSITVDKEITRSHIEDTIKDLPIRKAPGPDDIQNETLKAAKQLISPALAAAFQACLTLGYFPRHFKNTTTIVLRKPGKKDYSLPSSYRPIALENTMGKVLEKILAKRLTDTLESHNLLPETQYGARKSRSTTTALTLLTATAQSVWNADPSKIVSVLSLDLSSAFDKVSHTRLLDTAKRKGLPEWLRQITAGFLKERTTSIAFDGNKTERIQVETGIPQGSPLSPILFLLFIAPLLERVNAMGGAKIGMGFVDDTNLITWGPKASTNCRSLEQMHKICEEWATESGASFAPDKYQLIHLTRQQKADTTATVNIPGFAGQPIDNLRVLGVWVDKKLKWTEHIRRTKDKGLAGLTALTRIVGSTWGLSFERTRLLYTAVIRPTICFGAEVWGIGDKGTGLPRYTIRHLKLLQNKATRLITGGFKNSPTTALERETGIPPIESYIRARTLDHALKVSTETAHRDILQRCRQIQWTQRKPAKWRRPRNTRTQGEPPKQAAAIVIQKAAEVTTATIGNPPGKRWLKEHWDRYWEKERQGKQTPIWLPLAKETGASLRKDLPRPVQSIITQLRTHAIGLNGYLARRRVPGISPECECKQAKQSIKHILLFCPLNTQGRAHMLLAAGTSDFNTLLTTKKGVQEAAKWIFQQGILQQFAYAKRMADKTEPTTEWKTLEFSEDEGDGNPNFL